MGFIKTRKIKKYLNLQKNLNHFDYLLQEYVNKSLKTELQRLDLTNISLFVNFKEENKSILVDANFHDIFIKIYFEENFYELLYDSNDIPNQITVSYREIQNSKFLTNLYLSLNSNLRQIENEM